MRWRKKPVPEAMIWFRRAEPGIGIRFEIKGEDVTGRVERITAQVKDGVALELEVELRSVDGLTTETRVYR